jgi:predicted metal-dependent HD superfamily phosphohydrolase
MKLHNKSAYPRLCLELLSTLETSLPDSLTYHSLSHTIDVANVCNAYIERYGIDDNHAKLIRIAAVGHDFGYIISPKDHEERSIKTLSRILPSILDQEEILLVNGMIRATKVPQEPKTLYEQIVADADLDYLGRPDYDVLSAKLYQEFQYYKIVNTQEDWLDLQIKFLQNHKYHTPFAQEHRKPLKLQKLEELKEKREALEC